MSKLEVDTIAPQSGTQVTIGESGDTVTIPTGVTLDASNATTTLPANVVTTDGTQTLTNKSIAATQLTGTITPSDNTVTTAKIVDGAVTSAKITYPLTTFSSTGIDDNATSTALTIDSSGRVGIGDTTPGGILEVSDTDNETYLFITNAKSGGSGQAILVLRNDAGNWQVKCDIDDTFKIRDNANASNRLVINSSGYVGINTNSTTRQFNVYSTGIPVAKFERNQGDNALRTHLEFIREGNTAGEIQCTNTSTTYATSSDYRLKENVSYDFDATTRLKQLKPARFNFIANADTTVDGFLAHEVQSIVPEAITGTHNETETKEKVVVSSNGQVIAENIEQADWEAGKIADENGNTQYPTDSTWEATKVVPVYQGIDQSKLVPLLVKTIQELEARITQLENA